MRGAGRHKSTRRQWKERQWRKERHQYVRGYPAVVVVEVRDGTGGGANVQKGILMDSEVGYGIESGCQTAQHHDLISWWKDNLLTGEIGLFCLHHLNDIIGLGRAAHLNSLTKRAALHTWKEENLIFPRPLTLPFPGMTYTLFGSCLIWHSAGIPVPLGISIRDRMEQQVERYQRLLQEVDWKHYKYASPCWQT